MKSVMRINLILCFTLFIAMGPLVFGKESGALGPVDSRPFGKVWVLDQGRKKPMDTYARSILLRFSGRSSMKGKSAVDWILEVFFKPEQTKDQALFRIYNSEVLTAMGLEAQESRRYSYNQLQPGLKKLSEVVVDIDKIEEKNRTGVEAELMRVYGNLTHYINLAAVFQFAIPYEDYAVRDSNLANYLGIKPYPTLNSYYRLFSKAVLLYQVLDTLKNKPSQSQWSSSEAEIFRLTQKMYQWSNFYQNIPVLLIPTFAHGQESWVSPWDAINNHVIAGQVGEELKLLVEACESYLGGDSRGFETAVESYNQSIVKRVGKVLNLKSNGLELLYNRLDVFFWLKVSYGVGALVLLFSFVAWYRFNYNLGLAILVVSFLFHTAGILMRMWIMNRPPVTNLYETFLFVGWAIVVLCIISEWLQKRGIGILSACISGFFLLMIAGKYAKEGDTMGMLVAVLDSNFWLATHVICITLGYAGACAAGVVGHVYIFQHLLSKDKKKLRDTNRAVYGILAFGLALSFVGTVLGGIWADQSWGRFWGWDPKENGALLIVLWCAILIHARLDGMIREFGLAVGSVIGIMVVMFAWFGVNLMGVGLHSYGFTSGVFWRLIIYCGSEITFLLVALFFYSVKKKKEVKA